MMFRQVDDVVTSVSFLAAKIVETQFRLLSPTFGRECVLDSPGTTWKSGYVGIRRVKCMQFHLAGIHRPICMKIHVASIG